VSLTCETIDALASSRDMLLNEVDMLRISTVKSHHTCKHAVFQRSASYFFNCSSTTERVTKCKIHNNYYIFVTKQKHVPL